LRPGACLDERRFEPHRGWRAGPQTAQVVSNRAHDLLARFRRAFPAAAGAFLNDAFEERLGECDARRLDRVQIDGREKARAAGQAIVARGERENILEGADARSFRRAQRVGRRGRLAKVAHGRERFAEVEDAVFPDRGHRGAVDVGPEDARCEGACVTVRGQGRLFAQVGRRHGPPRWGVWRIDGVAPPL
jgi:hypothetical protein